MANPLQKPYLYSIENHRICLLIDTYEETAKFLDAWLRDVLDNRHGDFDANVILTISGRLKLDANRWSVYNDLCIALPVEPFSEEEANSFLGRKGITGQALRETISRLSGNVPVLMATLAEASPSSAGGLEDVSNLAIERFLKWVANPVQRDTALHAALPLHLNLDVLSRLVTPEKASELFDWLQSMPFVQKRAQHDKGDYSSLSSALGRIMKSGLLEEENRPIALAWRAEVKRLSGKYDEALADFKQAVGLKPGYEWAIALRGSTYQQRQRLAGTAAYFLLLAFV